MLIYIGILTIIFVFGYGETFTEPTKTIIRTGIHGFISILLIHPIISIYLIPISLSIYAETESISKSLDPSEIINIIYNKQYLIYTFISTIIFIFGFLITGIIFLILYHILYIPILQYILSILSPLFTSPIIILSIHILTIGIRESIKS